MSKEKREKIKWGRKQSQIFNRKIEFERKNIERTIGELWTYKKSE